MEKAADMVKNVADPDALFMMGAAFDEGLEDEIRVTVIATGFGDVANPVPGKQDKSAGAEGAGGVNPPKPLDENGKEESGNDPFDDIFKIFNKK